MSMPLNDEPNPFFRLETQPTDVLVHVKEWARWLEPIDVNANAPEVTMVNSRRNLDNADMNKDMDLCNMITQVFFVECDAD